MYGNMETNIGVPLSPEKGSEQAEGQMDRLYAWNKPDQPVYFYSLPDHPGH
jgi:hypothetical protein